MTLGLYVFRIPGGPCKIGRSRDLARRLCEVQTHHPYDLEMVAWLPEQGHQESAWHHCFDQFRLRGEWFEWVPQIAKAVELAKAGEDWTEVAEPPPELLAELLAAYGSSDMEQGKSIYRAVLRKGGRLPRRPNTPPTPKSPGPVPKHRREVAA